MTITEIGQIMADIIADYMALDDARVILKDEGFDGPKDDQLYVLIEYEGDIPVAVGSHVDTSTQVETSHYSAFANFTVEAVSRNRDATNRYQEIPMALQSVAGQQAAELAQVSFFRGSPLNLSAIEGVASLRRWHIPVIVAYMSKKTATAPTIKPVITEVKTEAK